jgi:hypothetical protein
MPRKTRILHGEDEYLFVDAPGDAAGPTLLILARPENARAVAAGRVATHQSEHGQWCPVARFDGETLLLAPDPPDGLAERLREMLPRYAESQRQRIAQAKNSAWYVEAGGLALHALHAAQPAGLMLRLFRTEEAAAAALRETGGKGRVVATGDLREFLELRAEEGYAGALLDDEEIVFFFLDEKSHVEFVKVRAAERDRDVESEILDPSGKWRVYDGDEELDPLVDPDAWDRLMRRAFGAVPFVGYAGALDCFALRRDGEAVATADADGENMERIVPLFRDAPSAQAFVVRERLDDVEVEPVADLRAELMRAAELGAVARLQPGDHRARGGVLWVDQGDVLLDGFSGLWRSHDGRTFEALDE